MSEVAHLTEDGIKDIYMRGKINPGRSVISELLVRLPLILEGVQLHSYIRRVALPARTIATFLIRGYFKPTTRCPLYFRRARPRAFFRNSISILVNSLPPSRNTSSCFHAL